MKENLNTNRRAFYAMTAVTLLCLGGAVFSLLAAWDAFLFLHSLQSSKLANPPRKGTLILLLPLLAILAFFLIMAAWRTWQRGSQHRLMIVNWPVISVFFWALMVWSAVLVNYPIPPQVHHTDKFLISCLILLLWSLIFTLWPRMLEKILNSKPYSWVKLALINVVVFVALGESVFRMVDPILARNALFGSKHTPANLRENIPVQGSIGRTNSQGFRDRERVFERSGSVPRLLALGDSFTWGAGVSYDEAFVTLLEQRLGSSLHDLEIINLGVPAWGPSEELHLLTIYGIHFSPDLVMLNFFIGNDIQNKRGDDVNLPQVIVVAGHSYYVHRNGNLVHDLLGPDRWYLYHNMNFFFKMAASKIHRAFDTATSKTEYDGPPMVSRKHYLKAIHERSDIYLKHDTEFFLNHWNRTQVVLLQMQQFLTSRQVPMLLIMIPEPIQLDSKLQIEYFNAFSVAPELYDFEKPQRLLHGWCQKNGVECIDLLPLFRTQSSPEKLYFVNDFHFSSVGHVLAAEGILPTLQNYLDIGMISKGQNKKLTKLWNLP